MKYFVEGVKMPLNVIERGRASNLKFSSKYEVDEHNFVQKNVCFSMLASSPRTPELNSRGKRKWTR